MSQIVVNGEQQYGAWSDIIIIEDCVGFSTSKLVTSAENLQNSLGISVPGSCCASFSSCCCRSFFPRSAHIKCFCMKFAFKFSFFFFFFVCLHNQKCESKNGAFESNTGKEKNHQKKKKSIHTINNCVETLHCFLFVLFCLVWSGRIFPSLCFSPDLPHSLSLSRWQWPLTFSRSSFLARQVLLGFSSHSLSLLLSFSYCFVDKKKPSADLKVW